MQAHPLGEAARDEALVAYRKLAALGCRATKPGGLLILYGPFARSGGIAPSNAAFDENLKSRNPDWGVRDLDGDISPRARAAGLELTAVTEMPANNLTVVFQRR